MKNRIQVSLEQSELEELKAWAATNYLSVSTAARKLIMTALRKGNNDNHDSTV